MKIWQFMEVVDGGPNVWTWRVLGPSGNLEKNSEPHGNYGAAVMDAIKHGFLPSNDHWIVITSTGVTRFEPGGKTREHRAAERAPTPRGLTDGTGTGS
jgi:hypothetical protein